MTNESDSNTDTDTDSNRKQAIRTNGIDIVRKLKARTLAEDDEDEKDEDREE